MNFALLLAFLLPAAAFQLPCRVPSRLAIARVRSLAMAEDDTAGRGFGTPNYEAEEARGRDALEAMRAAQADRGYDSSLQGLRDKPMEAEPTPEELNEFKSQITLGLAGFLIVGGVLSLFVGGSLWEPKGANEDGTPPAQSEPAFGFVPQSKGGAAPSTGAPSWASQ